MFNFAKFVFSIGFSIIGLPQLFAYEMEDVSRINFEMRDPKSKEVYFQGYELITFQEKTSKKETWYKNLKGEEVQYEFVEYDKQNLRVLSYRFKNSVTGEETNFDTESNSMAIRYRPEFQKPYKDGKLNWEENAYHGKVFNNLILRNWASIRQGKDLRFLLVLPYRFESLGFKIVYGKSKEVDGEKREVFELKPKNPIIRAIAPAMEFHYTSGDKPRIRQFTGPSTIPIKGEKDKQIDIIFSYPPA